MDILQYLQKLQKIRRITQKTNINPTIRPEKDQSFTITKTFPSTKPQISNSSEDTWHQGHSPKNSPSQPQCCPSSGNPTS